MSTHCALWLCAVTSWNGSQNAAKLGSLPAARSSSEIAAIQICGCVQFGSKGLA